MGKKLVTISEIVFAVVFIVMMAGIFVTVNRFGGQANNIISNIQQSIEDSDMSSYNDTVVSGDAVRSIINNMKETRNGLKLSYLVVDSSKASNHDYGYGGIVTDTTNKAFDSDGSELASIGTKTPTTTYKSYDISTKIDAAEFINPVDKYESDLIFNANGVIIGIRFTKV